jgi:multiple sugar transport system substrate-binding protein
VEDLGRENFSEQDLYHNTLNGEVWGVPFFTIPHVLFYRTDLLEEAGFDGPPTTWDEFQDVAETLTSGDRYGYVGFMNDPSVGHLLHQWMAARGAETFGPDLELTIDSPETRDTLEFLAGLHQDGYMYEGSISYGMGDARVFFVNDRAAMISTSTSFARVFSGEPIQENIAAAPLPKNGGTDNYYAMRSLGISSDPQSLEAAEYVLEWIYQADNYLQYFSFPEAKLGFLPSYNVIVEDESFWSLPEVSDLRPIFEPALEAASQGWYPGMKYQVNQFVALFDAQNIYQDMLLRVIVDDWEVEQASEWAAEQMQEIMDRQ